MNKTVIAITILKKLVFTAKWKAPKSKALAIIITVLLIISMYTLLEPHLSVNAHSPAWSIPTQAYINVTPNPVIVGQNVTITIWLNEPPPTANGTYGDRWQNMTVKYVRPDGTTHTIGPYSSDETGRVVVNKTTDIVGPHSFWMTFGGQTLEGVNLAPGTTNEFIGDYYQPSISDVFALSVQMTLGDPTPTPTTAPSLTSTTTYTSIPTTTPRPTASPTPTESEATIPATTDNGSTIHLAINGNITASQISNVVMATNQSESTTTLSFTLTGQSGTTGFSNITIPKNSVTFGTTPKIYVDGQPASNQGYIQNSNNYCIWYSTSFSSHQISIIFTVASSPSPTASNSGSQGQSSLSEVVYGLVAAVTVVIVVVIVLQVVTKGRRAKTGQSK